MAHPSIHNAGQRPTVFIAHQPTRNTPDPPAPICNPQQLKQPQQYGKRTRFPTWTRGGVGPVEGNGNGREPGEARPPKATSRQGRKGAPEEGVPESGVQGGKAAGKEEEEAAEGTAGEVGAVGGRVGEVPRQAREIPRGDREAKEEQGGDTEEATGRARKGLDKARRAQGGAQTMVCEAVRPGRRRAKQGEDEVPGGGVQRLGEG